MIGHATTQVGPLFCPQVTRSQEIAELGDVMLRSGVVLPSGRGRQQVYERRRSVRNQLAGAQPVRDRRLRVAEVLEVIAQVVEHASAHARGVGEHERLLEEARCLLLVAPLPR